MGRLRRVRTHKGIKDISKKFRTKRRTKDLDQIEKDLEPQAFEALKTQELDADLPGLAQFYCVHCSRYFVDQPSLDNHTKSKVHKRRLKNLKEGAYTIEESEAAVGLTTENSRPIQDATMSTVIGLMAQ
eukprot:Partr_v1_DN26547_c1_g3_i1_m3523 putative Zinc finger protein